MIRSSFLWQLLPGPLSAWFGMDSVALVARGARAGLPVLAYKRGERLGGTRLVARSNDDRSGSTALLFAVQKLDRSKLTKKTYFVWSVREEGGLNGARAFGACTRANSRASTVSTRLFRATPRSNHRILPMRRWARAWCSADSITAHSHRPANANGFWPSLVPSRFQFKSAPRWAAPTVRRSRHSVR